MKAKTARKRAKPKTSLVGNINKRKREGKSRPKSRSTISKEAYEKMERAWQKKPKKQSR